MKRCPTCQKTYPDDAPGFCSNDGTRLVSEGSAEYDPQKTILSSTPAPPPQQYSAPQPTPDNPPQPQPYSPPPQPPQQQQAWPNPPPQQQAQNYGGGYYPPQGQAPVWPPPYAQPAGKGKGLSLSAFITGLVSGVLGGLLLASYLGAFSMTRGTAIPMLIAAIALGAISLVLGFIALFSSRQGGKGVAAIGMILAAFSIGFWIYLEIEHGILFR